MQNIKRKCRTLLTNINTSKQVNANTYGDDSNDLRKSHNNIDDADNDCTSSVMEWSMPKDDYVREDLSGGRRGKDEDDFKNE